MTKTIVFAVVLSAWASVTGAQTLRPPRAAAPSVAPPEAPPAPSAPAAAPVPSAPPARSAPPSPPGPRSPAPAAFGSAASPLPPFALPDVDWTAFAATWPEVHMDLDATNAAIAESIAAMRDALDARRQAVQAPKPSVNIVPAPPSFGRGDEGLYDQARGLIERNQYDRALPVLDRVIDARGTRADAALYWKAYSLSKLARRDEALTVLAELQKQFPNAAWVRDARALEVELRQASGQSVSADLADDELKVLALRGVMQNDPERAVPAVERILSGTSSVRVKDRALFVLSQSRATRAREVIANVATASSANPELRVSAVRYMAMRADPESMKVLADLYGSSSDVELKQVILRSMITGNAIDRLAQVARTEKNAELQQLAIRNLGASNRPEAADALRTIYQSDVPVDTKKVVIQALAMHQNASVLVALAKAEKNADLKKEMVSRLSTMRSPEARDYMLELLK